MTRLTFVGLLFLGLAIGFQRDTTAASPKSTTTTILIDGEFCSGCLAKLKRGLAEVRGVAAIDGDVAKKLVMVKSKPSITLSPKVLWEAVEKTGKKPAKLTGPSGSFTSKPKS